MPSKNRISVGLEAAEYAELAALAHSQHVSLAWLGRQAVLRLLQQQREREFEFPATFPSANPSANQEAGR